MIYENVNAVEYETLKAGIELPYLTANVQLKSESDLPKGAVLSEELELVDATKKASYVLAESVEGGSETQIAQVYLTGIFNADALTLDPATTISKHLEELRSKGIYVKGVMK